MAGAAQRRLAQEAGARLAVQDRDRLQQRLVAVELLQRQVSSQVAPSCAGRRGRRPGCGRDRPAAAPGSAPARSRIQAAWRASTATMPAASCDGVAREARALADVRGGRRLLEIDRRRAEALAGSTSPRGSRTAAPAARVAAEPLAQQRDVVVLLRGDDLRVAQELAAQRAALAGPRRRRRPAPARGRAGSSGCARPGRARAPPRSASGPGPVAQEHAGTRRPTPTAAASAQGLCARPSARRSSRVSWARPAISWVRHVPAAVPPGLRARPPSASEATGVPPALVGVDARGRAAGASRVARRSFASWRIAALSFRRLLRRPWLVPVDDRRARRDASLGAVVVDRVTA